MADTSLINLGELSKPATALIEKVSDGIEGIVKPFQIVRVAKAEAKASLIAAGAQIEIDELQQRALSRFAKEQAMHQANIEGITQKAIPLLSADAEPEKMDNDWVANFFAKSRLVSDDEMQALWSRVLANEANAQGSFSRKTVNLMADLERKDAEAFSRLCNYQWGNTGPLIFDLQAPIFLVHGLNFDVLSQLENLGLIQTTPSGYAQQHSKQKTVVTYGARKLELTFQKEYGNRLDVGMAIFTKAGRELAQLCELDPVRGYFDYVQNHWQLKGIATKEINE